jgi:septum formation protein
MDDFIFLASHSPRRRELLRLTGLKFELFPIEITDENLLLDDYNGEIIGQAEHIANSKLAIAMKANLPGTFITADTIVVSEDGVVLGKPSTEKEAELFLDRLAGNWHTVATGVAIGKWDKSEYLGGKKITDSILVTTRVKFGTMSKLEIREYIATGEPFDKAGAYGIQGRASIYIEKIDGCYFNVVGFPLNAFWKMWQKFRKRE